MQAPLEQREPLSVPTSVPDRGGIPFALLLHPSNFTQTTTRLVISNACKTKFILRSRQVASHTTTTASGCPKAQRSPLPPLPPQNAPLGEQHPGDVGQDKRTPPVCAVLPCALRLRSSCQASFLYVGSFPCQFIEYGTFPYIRIPSQGDQHGPPPLWLFITNPIRPPLWIPVDLLVQPQLHHRHLSFGYTTGGGKPLPRLPASRPASSIHCSLPKCWKNPPTAARSARRECDKPQGTACRALLKRTRASVPSIRPMSCNLLRILPLEQAAATVRAQALPPPWKLAEGIYLNHKCIRLKISIRMWKLSFLLANICAVEGYVPGEVWAWMCRPKNTHTQKGCELAEQNKLTAAMEDYLEMICRLSREKKRYTRVPICFGQTSQCQASHLASKIGGSFERVRPCPGGGGSRNVSVHDRESLWETLLSYTGTTC